MALPKQAEAANRPRNQTYNKGRADLPADGHL